MSKRKYYIIRSEFVNVYTLLYVHDAADVNALAELQRRGEKPERITRADALRLARAIHDDIYKATSLFVYDPIKSFGDDLIYMDYTGKHHGYNVL